MSQPAKRPNGPRVELALAVILLLLAPGSPAAAVVGQVAAGAEFTPASCTEMFPDVPASSAFCPWIEQLVADGVSGGCGDGTKFCPDQPVTRGQLAMFLERAMRGTAAWDVNADLLDGHDSTEFVTAASQTWSSGRRHYYVTAASFNGSQAPGACAAGYHMASIWDLMDLPSMIYDTNLGFSFAGAGDGPPLAVKGWIRTGWFSSSASSLGANCLQYSVTSGSGTTAGLDLRGVYFNDDGAFDITLAESPWGTEVRLCNLPTPVWCAQD